MGSHACNSLYLPFYCISRLSSLFLTKESRRNHGSCNKTADLTRDITHRTSWQRTASAKTKYTRRLFCRLEAKQLAQAATVRMMDKKKSYTAQTKAAVAQRWVDCPLTGRPIVVLESACRRVLRHDPRRTVSAEYEWYGMENAPCECERSSLGGWWDEKKHCIINSVKLPFKRKGKNLRSIIWAI